MKNLAVVALAFGFLMLPAVTDEPTSDAKAKSIQAPLGVWNCAGGEIEKESGDVAANEIGNAECANGEYDFKRHGDFNIAIESAGTSLQT